MELRHIRYFVRAAELMHFTHAAESLYISQPTLSTHIQQLEDELGVPLFERTGRSVLLTEAGRLYLKHARCALKNLDEGKQSIEDLKGLGTGEIRIGSLLTFGHEILPAWIASFHAKHPKIKMVVETGASDDLEDQVTSGTIDLALSFVPPDREECSWKQLYREEVFLAVGDTSPLASKSKIAISELQQIPLALVGRKWAVRRLYDAFFAQHKIEPQVLLEIDDLNALLKVAAAGHLGVLIARIAAGSYPGLRLIPIAGANLYANYGVLWQGYLSPAADAFLQHIIEQTPQT